MKLLVILLCLGLERFLQAGTFLYRFSWFDWYVEKFQKAFSTTVLWRNYLALALVALPIVILIGLIYYVTYYWLHGWLKFLIATLVLLYCLGPEDLYRQKQKGTVSQDIFWQANEKLFAVLFWFALIGPVAAVLYRVVEQLTKSEQRGNVVNHELAKSANTLLFILDWLPIRVFSLIFALVGNFVKTFSFWLDQVTTGWSNNRNLIEKSGRLAQGLEENAQMTPETMLAAYGLIDRSLIVFIVVVAVFILGAWL